MTTAPTLVPVPERRPAARIHSGAHLDTPLARRGVGAAAAVAGAHALELPLDHERRLPTPPELGGRPAVLPFATRLSQVLVEVLAGSRPAPQVVRYVAPDVYSAIARRALVAARRGSVAIRVAIRRVRVFEVSPEVAEVSTVIHGRDRVTAMAMRLEDQDGRWVVTALSVG